MLKIFAIAMYTPNEVKWKRAKMAESNPLSNFPNRIPKKESDKNANSWQECMSVFLCVHGLEVDISIVRRMYYLYFVCTAGDNGNAMYKQVRCEPVPARVRAYSTFECKSMLHATELAYAACMCVLGRPNIVGICIYYTYSSLIRIT